MGESDMDYDTDETSMAELRRRLKKCKETYTRYKRLKMNCLHPSILHTGWDDFPPSHGLLSD